MIDLPTAIEWYTNWKTQDLQDRLEKMRDGEETAEDYDTEYRKWKSVRMKLEAVKESGQLITIEEAEDAMLDRLIVIRDALKNIPISWQHRVVGLEDKQEAQERLEDLLDDLLTTLSNAPDDIQHTVDGEEIIDFDIDDVEDV